MKPKKKPAKGEDLLAGLAPHRRREMLKSLANEATVWIAARSPLVSALPKLLGITPALVAEVLAEVALAKRDPIRILGRGRRTRYELLPPSPAQVREFLAWAAQPRARGRRTKLKAEDEAFYGKD